jgi:hypothetical protein
MVALVDEMCETYHLNADTFANATLLLTSLNALIGEFCNMLSNCNSWVCIAVCIGTSVWGRIEDVQWTAQFLSPIFLLDICIS